ncbi:MAG: hypothetical protein K2W96_02745, partial [Gemmataceae bacterium]|nr:hypothetical protein [Gemmataceae bacterium]
ASFNHLSGERLLSLPAGKSGSASLDIHLPEDGTYRLWVRYEYPAFCDCTFTAVVEQGGKESAHVMGTPTSLRYAFGDPVPKAQHDPSWGPEGLMAEPATVRGLKKGKARLILKGAALPKKPGVSADRNIDLVYLTRDEADRWRPHYAKEANLYPILGAFRDTRGPRWEVRFTNRGKEKRTPRVQHVYNRLPWGMAEVAEFKAVSAGESTGWTGLRSQDTSHFSMVEFSLGGMPLEVEVRPAGGGKGMAFKGEKAVRLYLPTYPGKGEEPTPPEEAIARILDALKKAKAPGKKPTAPLCYGGWMPVGAEGEYGRKHAELYAGLGFASLHPALSGPKAMENLKAVGIGPTKSWMAMGYRNPPTKDNIAKAKADLARTGMAKHLRFFDYGDEIGFSEWMDMMAAEDVADAKAKGATITPAQAVNTRWAAWLITNRKDKRVQDYWLPAWGRFDIKGLRPDSSADAARLNPRLYVDSLLFYEEAAIAFAAKGMQAVKAEFGQDVLCGANYSCHPFYYPSSTMYIKWFRGGAADLGRHSEYFWQVAQAGPMVNGYVAEHFRAGLRDVKGGVLRQYTMPHAPGNTDASFLRSCFTHLAHGATMLDFFGVGPNETFTENHIDHRALSRFVAVRDVTHSVGLVEDLLPESKPLPSKVALLVSESTERRDMAGIATDRAGHAHFGKDFRKTRTLFHLERLGLWKALTFAGNTPDLVTEEDIIAGKLGEAKLLVLVGDCWKKGTVPAIQKWVEAGGVALSTAGAGARDEYGEPVKDYYALAGLKDVKTDLATTFLRPRQELPFLKPLREVKGDRWTMPALAVREDFKPVDGTEGWARSGDAPILLRREAGKGRIFHMAAMPGLASLWSALQPPAVPDRGPGTHAVPTKFDKGAAAALAQVLEDARVQPDIVAEPKLLDARLLVAKGGYILPVASYTGKDEEKATLTVRVPAPIKKATSAREGELKAVNGKGTVTITLSRLRYGDVVRLER